ncbi:MAG TPA: helix-turn-helix domain-containing protein [Gemmatimonadaceae bacterium]
MTSRSSVPIIIGYVPVQTERARISRALPGWARAKWTSSVTELPAAIRRARGAPAAVVVSVREGNAPEAARAVREILRVAPQVAVVAYCRAGVEHARHIRMMAAAGVHEFLFVGVDDRGLALRAVVASAQRACAAAAVLAAVLPAIPAPLHRFAEFCVTHPARARTVAGVAEMLGVHRKTLLNQCARAGAPAPAEMIAWCRLMLAAQLLAATGQTVEWVALELDYPSDTALRNAMKRYTGRRASDVRREGGLVRVLESFARRGGATGGFRES